MMKVIPQGARLWSLRLGLRQGVRVADTRRRRAGSCGFRLPSREYARLELEYASLMRQREGSGRTSHWRITAEVGSLLA
jgi:hypothetical protein